MDHFQPAIIVPISLAYCARSVTIFNASAASQITLSLIIAVNVLVIGSNLQMEHVIYVTSLIRAVKHATNLYATYAIKILP